MKIILVMKKNLSCCEEAAASLSWGLAQTLALGSPTAEARVTRYPRQIPRTVYAATPRSHRVAKLDFDDFDEK